MMTSAHDLAAVVVAQCSQVFDRRLDPPEPELQIFDMFQSAIGRLVRGGFRFLLRY